MTPTPFAPALRRSFAWVGAGQSAFFVLSFVGSVAIARLLTPYDAGVFAIATAAVALLGIIQAIGLNSFLVREPTLTPELIATASSVNAVMSIMLAIGVASLGLLGAVFFDRSVRDVLLVVAVVPLLGQLAFVPNALLEREGAFRTLAMIKTASAATGLALTIGFALAGFRYMSFAYSQVITALLTNLATMLIAKRHVTFRVSLAHWSTVSKFAAQVFAVSGVVRIAQRLSELVLGHIAGLPALGLFSRASGNYNMLWDNIHAVATRVLFQDFATLRREGQSLRVRYLQVSTVITALLWPAFIGVAVIAGPLVHLIYGARWDGAATPLSFLCIAGVGLTSITMTWEVFVVSGETGRQARLEATRTIIGFALFVAGCLYSLNAAALARVGDALVAQGLYRRHLCRLTDVSPAELRRIYLQSGLLTLPAVLPAVLVMTIYRWSPAVPGILIVAAILLGAASWLLTIRGTQHPLWAEISRLTRATIGSRRPTAHPHP